MKAQARESLSEKIIPTGKRREDKSRRQKSEVRSQKDEAEKRFYSDF
jgi:hypothetical protein